MSLFGSITNDVLQLPGALLNKATQPAVGNTDNTPVLGVNTYAAPGVIGSNTGSTGSNATRQVAPAVDVSQYDQGINTIQGTLDRIPNQLGIAQGNIRSTYGQNDNELNSNRDQAQNSYNTSTTQNQQQFVTNKNQVNQQASTGLTSLLRMLGQHGAGGSSAAQFAAPTAVSNVAARARSGAGQTYGQNQQSLDTNWGNFQTGFENSKRQLSDWLTQHLNEAQATSDGSRQGLLGQLAQIQAQRAAALGHNPATAAQPFLDQASALSGEIDSLGRLNPTYTGAKPVYNAPTVESYTVNHTGAPTLGTYGNNTGASATPALSFLLGLNKDNKQGAF